MPFPTKDFPSAEDRERINREDLYFKLLKSEWADYSGETDLGKWRLKEFFENDSKKAAILDRALNLVPLIAEAGVDFLFGEPFRVQIDDGQEGDEARKKLQAQIDAFIERNDLQERFSASALIFQSIGHTQFKMYGKPEGGKTLAAVEEVPFSYWFPNWSGVPDGTETENVRLVVFITSIEGDGEQKKKYIFVEDYYMEGGKAVISYSLWEDSGGRIGGQLPLDKLPGLITDSRKADATAEGLFLIQRTKFTRLPLFWINLRKTALDRYGESAFKKVKPLLHELNDRMTQLSIQFLKHLNAKLQLPDGAAVRDPKTGKIQRTELEVLLARAGEPDAKYITNENPLIEECFTHIDKVVRKIAKLTQTPDSFLLEDEKGGVEKAEALKTRLMLFLKRIRGYQRAYEKLIKDMVYLALEVEGVKDARTTVPLKVTFDTGLPKDWETDVTVWGSALGQGLASRETAVGRFQELEGDELEAELKRIDEEEQQAMERRVEEVVAAEGAAPDGE